MATCEGSRLYVYDDFRLRVSVCAHTCNIIRKSPLTRPAAPNLYYGDTIARQQQYRIDAVALIDDSFLLNSRAKLGQGDSKFGQLRRWQACVGFQISKTVIVSWSFWYGHILVWPHGDGPVH